MGQPIITKTDVDQRDYRAARWSLVGCSVLVFVTSVCIMVLELTASRLIAKSVGSSLYTWTSVIGVILAGISAGNFLGGWVADRYDHRRALAWLFFLASFFCMTIYPLAQMMSSRSRPAWIDWPVWVVIVVSSQYLHPSVILGMISPITASMALKNARYTGSTVGTVYAWGAMGSIFGTFLAGFYLISTFGTQHIVWMTAAVLALLGIAVAKGQSMFRGAVLFGWLQFVLLLGMLASVRTPDAYAFEVDASGKKIEKRPWTTFMGADASEWRKWLDDVTGKTHELGLKLKVRRDARNEYKEESDYFYISVADRREGGDTVKTLYLDHLAHSYYNPQKPNELYYTYEKVYAAITELATEHWNRTVSVDLAELPKDGLELPEWAKYDAERKKLSVKGGISRIGRTLLLGVSPSGAYWHAIETLTGQQDPKSKNQNSTAALPKLPPGVQIPPALAKKLRFHSDLGLLTRDGKISAEERDELFDLSPDRAYRRAVEDLYGKSRQVSTLFIGGGGFVFPRWIETFFPYQPLIHVLELDPAVKLAVQREMGLPPDDKTFVKTIVGDARNSVDDLLNGLNRDPAQLGPHNHYDFIYGDAFNDFSVPWHLTTQEFAEKIKRLLTPDEGMFLVNIIDIYPRADFPVQIPKGSADVSGVIGPLPPELWSPKFDDNAWHHLKDPGRYGSFQAMLDPDKPGTYRIRCQEALTDRHYNALKDLLDAGSQDPAGKAGAEKTAAVGPLLALEELYDESNRTPSYTGDLPEAMLPANTVLGKWTWAKAPYDYIELKLQKTPADVKQPTPTSRSYVIGLRGVTSPQKEQELMQLAGDDVKLKEIFQGLIKQTHRFKPGRFLGAYVNTVCRVFPNVYVFSANRGLPDAARDTFVVACSLKPLDFSTLANFGEFWSTPPFASMETKSSGETTRNAQMQAILELSRGMTLTDDYAPVDNLLIPVFARQ